MRPKILQIFWDSVHILTHTRSTISAALMGGNKQNFSGWFYFIFGLESVYFIMLPWYNKYCGFSRGT